MIRWRFVITRLLIVVAILVLLRWGLGPVAEYVTIRGVETAVGARAEIGRTQVGLFPPRIVYTDFRIADPRADKGLKNAFSADSIDLVIDGDSLLHRRLIIGDARISGLQVGTDRETSGHLPDEPELIDDIDDGPSMFGKLFGSVAGNAEEQVEKLIAEMETKRVSEEIRSRWEQEYRQLATRAKELEVKIREIRDRTRDISNPLRDLPEVQRTLADMNAMREELLAVRAKIDSLPSAMQADYAKLDAAKQHDLEKIKSIIPVDLSQGTDVAVDLLVASVRQQVNRIRGYLESGRTIADYTVVAPKSERERGVDYDMFGTNRRPSILVRSCEVGGILRADGKIYSLTGVLENLTPTPEILDEPARARVRLEGPEIVRLEYVRDQRQGRDIDLLTLHFPTMHARPLRIGSAKNVGIDVSGGERELWVQIRNEGNQMQGRLVSKQTQVKMDLLVDPKLERSVAVQSLRSSLANVDRIEIDSQFQGTWKDMDVNLNTNLSRVFKQATHDAVVQQANATQEKLAAKVNSIHQEQADKLRTWLGSQQTEALSLLANTDKVIEDARQKVQNQFGDADTYLGKLRGAAFKNLR